MTDKHPSFWENMYTEGRTGWDRGASSPQLLAWLDNNALTPGSIIVPGCGNGYEVLTLSAAGFDVTGLDIAPTAIKHLRTQIEQHDLRAEVLQQNILEWQPLQLVDAVYEQTSLCALDPELWSQYEQQLHSWLKPGGKIYALWMQTHKEGGPPYHCDISDVKTLFSDSRWKWSKQENQVEHPTGIFELAYVLEKTTLC